jgi:CubicO group peptidase (beta-lactamase class C family)
MIKTPSFLILLTTLFCTQDLHAQLSEQQIRQIDTLFVFWNTPNHPGGAVGVMKGHQVIYSKAFGLASLEYLVPNTPGTRFNIASVSKQFTAFGMVLLQQDGKLSLDDDVRKYLPELPDFGEPITIRHLIHHTSGMRSLHALLGLAGWRDDDSRTNQDLFRFMKNQKDLNFPPGSEHLYCNTGYMLMADIIEKVTGEKFPDWMMDHVFIPLGMAHTYVEDDYTRVVPANATSYNENTESGFSRAVEFWGYVGSGNIHSTDEDLLIWLSNYYDPLPEYAKAFQMMQTRGILNNGDTLNYAFGINVGEYKAHKQLQHGGSIGGYRSYVQAFPDEELGIVVVTNFSSSDVLNKSNHIADLLLGIEPEQPATGLIRDSSIHTIPMSASMLETYAGHYWNDKDRYARKIYVKEDTLRYFRSESSESKLLPVGKDTFQMTDVQDVAMVSFRSTPGQPEQMVVAIDDQDPILFEAFTPPELNSALLKSYTGTYYSPELDTHYFLYVQGDSILMGNHTRHGDFKIDILRRNDLEAALDPFRTIRVKRDRHDRIEGLYVTNGRVRNLWFEKQ